MPTWGGGSLFDASRRWLWVARQSRHDLRAAGGVEGAMNVPAAMRGRADLAGVRLWVLKDAVFLAVSAVLLLAGSGHPAWLAAWAHLGCLVLYLTLVRILLYRLHPDLLAERSGVQEGAQRWDVPLASLSALWLPVLLYVIATVDERFTWPATIGWPVQVVGGPCSRPAARWSCGPWLPTRSSWPWSASSRNGVRSW